MKTMIGPIIQEDNDLYLMKSKTYKAIHIIEFPYNETFRGVVFEGLSVNEYFYCNPLTLWDRDEIGILHIDKIQEINGICVYDKEFKINNIEILTKKIKNQTYCSGISFIISGGLKIELISASSPLCICVFGIDGIKNYSLSEYDLSDYQRKKI